MACNIEQANNDIDRLLKSSVSENMKQELIKIKELLSGAKKLKLEEKNTKLKSVQQVLEQYKKDENIEKLIAFVYEKGYSDGRLCYRHDLEKLIKNHPDL